MKSKKGVVAVSGSETEDDDSMDSPLTSPRLPAVQAREGEGATCPRNPFRSSAIGCMNTDTMPTPRSKKKHYCPSRHTSLHYRSVTGSSMPDAGSSRTC